MPMYIQCMIHSKCITLCRDIGTLINCFSVCILYMCVYMSTAVWMYVGW